MGATPKKATKLNSKPRTGLASRSLALSLDDLSRLGFACPNATAIHQTIVSTRTYIAIEFLPAEFHMSWRSGMCDWTMRTSAEMSQN